MVKYAENRFDEDYIQTLGVNFLEKSISLRGAAITFSIWDLGGHREFLSMLPLVCNDAAVIFFMFDLSRLSTLGSVKQVSRCGGLSPSPVATAPPPSSNPHYPVVVPTSPRAEPQGSRISRGHQVRHLLDSR